MPMSWRLRFERFWSLQTLFAISVRAVERKTKRRTNLQNTSRKAHLYRWEVIFEEGRGDTLRESWQHEESKRDEISIVDVTSLLSRHSAGTPQT